MPGKSTAVVFVSKDWFDTTLRYLIDTPPSGSTGAAHLLIGPLKNAGDPFGLWLEGIPTRHVQAGATVDMELLIPWQYVLCLSVVDGPSSAVPLGFARSSVTVLNAASSGGATAEGTLS